MNAAAMNAVVRVVEPAEPGRAHQEFTWAQVNQRAPKMGATMARYLDQLTISARPSTVGAFDLALRQFAYVVTHEDPTCRSVAGIERRHLEHYKRWLATRPGQKTKHLASATVRQRLGLLRTFFERVIEWGYDDAPARVPIYPGDFPQADDALPKFLDDAAAAKFMAALAADPNPRRRLLVELLARTGMRISELAGLEADAMVRIGDIHWLRIPVGKLHNDRYVPLHPVLVELITNYQATRGPSRSGRLLERRDGQPFDGRTIYRNVTVVAKHAGVGHVHPHQLRHTLATQAINRGMSLEAIAALLGHRSLRMTQTYARISDRTIAEEYFKVTAAVEAGYGHATELPADTAGDNMTRLARDHRRMLGNGHCTRPAALDCAYETMCERCGFFATGPEFVPVLIRQRDHATDNHQTDRAHLFNELLGHLDDST
jgi:site-specific recombinase XerD